MSQIQEISEKVYTAQHLHKRPPKILQAASAHPGWFFRRKRGLFQDTFSHKAFYFFILFYEYDVVKCLT